MLLTDGLCRDRSEFVGWIVLAGVILLLAALAIYIAGYVATREVPGTWRAWLLPPVFGDALGLLLPTTIATALKSIAPEPMATLSSSAWWPCLAGLLILILPAIVLRLSARASAAWSVRSISTAAGEWR